MADFRDCLMHDSCGFRACRFVKDHASPYCPRHKALVGAFGLATAEGMEFGYACDFCPAISAEEPLPCYACLQQACAKCRQEKRCCDGKEADLSRDACAAEREAYELRGQLSRLQARREMPEAAHA